MVPTIDSGTAGVVERAQLQTDLRFTKDATNTTRGPNPDDEGHERSQADLVVGLTVNASNGATANSSYVIGWAMSAPVWCRRRTGLSDDTDGVAR